MTKESCEEEKLINEVGVRKAFRKRKTSLLNRQLAREWGRDLCRVYLSHLQNIPQFFDIN